MHVIYAENAVNYISRHHWKGNFNYTGTGFNEQALDSNKTSSDIPHEQTNKYNAIIATLTSQL
jgi:hypothetical protein